MEKEEIDEMLRKIDKLNKTDFEGIYNECIKLPKFFKNPDDREYIIQSSLFDKNTEKVKWIVLGPKHKDIWWDEFGTNFKKLSKDKKEELFKFADKFEEYVNQNKPEQ